MIILGSKSPRRAEILKNSGLDYIIKYYDVDENVNCSNPYDYAMATAYKKSLPLRNEYKEDIILCCDTIVYVDNLILGKPKNKEEAYQMIKSISDKCHSVISGVCLVKGNVEKKFFVETKVYVSKLTEDEIMEYINTTEPYDKAGGYAIQGIFGKYIERIDGDYYNVVGLPINRIYDEIKKM